MPAAMLAASRRIRFSPLPQGRSPASRLLMTDCQSIWASSVPQPVSEVPVRDEAGEVVAVQPSGADDQVAGCFEGVESGGAGADSVGQAGLAGLDGWS